MLAELLSLNIFAFFMVFSRLGTAISIMPGFNATYVNIRARLVLALAISFVLTPMLASSIPPIPESAATLILLFVGEMVIGLFIGFVPFIVLTSLQVTGTFLAMVSSMANAFIADPISAQQSSIPGAFLILVATILLFVTDLHHVMIFSVVESYTLFVPGEALPAGDMADMIARLVTDSFKVGVQMAAPLVASALTYFIGLGLLSRLMPSLPVFFFGMPVQITLQLYLLLVTVSGIMLVFLSYFRETMGGFFAS